MPGDLTTDIHDAAAVWAERLLAAGQLDRAAQLRLEAWLEADPRHQSALNACLELEGLMDGARGTAWAEALIAEAEAELQAEARCSEGRPAVALQRRWTGPALAAMAAALVLAVALPLWSVLRVPPAPGGALQPAQTAAATYETRRGETLEVALDDGSVIELNTQSRISTEFTAGERHVVLLEGEALFDVAHDPQRPFTVSTGGHEVRAVGTAFSVYARGDGRTVVTVVEGLVQTRAEGGSFSAALLRPGDRVELAPGDASAAPVRVDAEAATSWTRGWLVFEDRPVADVIAEFRRYVDLDVEFAEDSLREIRVSGSFEPTDTTAFLRALESTERVRLDRLDGHVVIRRADGRAAGSPG